MKVRGYSVSEKLLRVEDYHLWIKMYKCGYRGKNIHKSLYQMRDDRNAYGRRSFKNRMNEYYVKNLAIRTFRLKKRNYLLHSDRLLLDYYLISYMISYTREG